MNEVYIPLIQTGITVAGSLGVAFGTWHITMKQQRKKDTDALQASLNQHRDEIRKEVRSLQDDLTQVQAAVQTNIALIDQKIDTLSNRVDKHNNLIERMYAVESKTAVQEEQIKVANHRIEDLEKAGQAHG